MDGGLYTLNCEKLLNHLKRLSSSHEIKLFMDDYTHTEAFGNSASWNLDFKFFNIRFTFEKGENYKVNYRDFGTHRRLLTHVCFEYSDGQNLSCPELVSDLMAGKYHLLDQHVANLLMIYTIPGDRYAKENAYLCLLALEEDVSRLSKTDFLSQQVKLSHDPHSDSESNVYTLSKLVNNSHLGHFTERSGGRLARLTYLVTPAQVALARNTRQPLITNTHSNSKSVGYGSDSGFLGGFVVSIGLRQSSRPTVGEHYPETNERLNHLSLVPTAAFQDAAEDTCGPQFADPDEFQCAALDAEFVLYLDPPLPLNTESLLRLEEITGLANWHLYSNEPERDIVQLILERHQQQHLYHLDTHLQLPNFVQHSYHCKASCLSGHLIHSIPFTHSRQLIEIISVLRKHATMTSFLETFIVHPNKPSIKDVALSFGFSINLLSSSHLQVTFIHPTEFARRVNVSIWMGPFAVERVVVNGLKLTNELSQASPFVKNGEDSSVTNTAEFQQYASGLTRILASSHALPVGMAWLMSALGCQVHEFMHRTGLSRTLRKHTSDDDTQLVDSNKIDPLQLEQLRTMLARARSCVLIEGTTGTGGILSGSDRSISLDVELAAQFTPSTFVPSKLPPLPPGVMATAPPLLSHAEPSPGSRNAELHGTQRGFSGSSLPVTNMTNTSCSTLRGLRLDDLLIGNITQNTALTSSVSSGTVSTYSSKPPVSPCDLSGSDAPTTLINLPGVLQTSALHLPPSKSTFGASLPANSFVSSVRSNPGYSLQSSTVGSIFVPGTFTQSSMASNPVFGASKSYAGSCSKVLNSGSMLVNLLNDDTPSSSVQSVLTQHLPVHSTTTVTSDVNRYAPSPNGPTRVPVTTLPGTNSYTLSNKSASHQAHMLHKPSSTVQGTATSPALPAICMPTISSSALCTLSALSSSSTPQISRTTHAATNPLISALGPTSKSHSGNNPQSMTEQASKLAAIDGKKPRKRRRGTSDLLGSSSTSKCASVGSVGSQGGPQVVNKYRSDLSSNTHPSITRSSYPPAHSNYMTPCLPPSSSSQLTSVSATLVSKSVYDFDDTPGASFDTPTPSISSSVSTSAVSQIGQSACTKLLNPSNFLTPSTAVIANSNPIGSSNSYHFGSGSTSAPSSEPLQISSTVLNSEHTVERKPSLKLTIKTLPSLSKTSKSFSTGNTSKNDSTLSKILSPKLTPDGKVKCVGNQGPSFTKKRKRRSVDGKPSSYILQELQQGPSSSVGAHNPSSISGKISKGGMNHNASIAQKQRKRRLPHSAIGDASINPILTGITGLGDSHGPVIKHNKIGRPRIHPDTSLQRFSGDASLCGRVFLPSVVSPSVYTVPSYVKKKSTIPAGTSHDPLASNKKSRLNSSSTQNYKRKKTDNDFSMRQFNTAPYVASQAELSEISAASTVTTTTVSHSIGMVPDLSSNCSSASSNSKLVRNASFPTPNATQHSRSLTGSSTLSRSQSTLTNMGSTSVPSTVHFNTGCSVPSKPMSSVSTGLIKGYKIPKKKTVSLPTEPTAAIVTGSTVSSINTVTCSSSPLGERFDKKGYMAETKKLPSIDLISTAMPLSQGLSNVSEEPFSSLFPQHSPLNTSASHSLSDDSPSGLNVTISPATTSSVLVATALPSSTPPARSAVKRINDVVDKLKAKSSKWVSSGGTAVSSQSSSLLGSNSSDVFVSLPSSSQETTPIECDKDVPTVLQPQAPIHDARGDNIFEKFYPSTPTGNPNPDVLESGNLLPKHGAAVSKDLTSATPLVGDENEVDPSDSFTCIADSSEDSLQTLLDDGDSRSVKMERKQRVQDAHGEMIESYEVIKAPTDTPASPTESSTQRTSSSQLSISKIIPVSPTGEGSSRLAWSGGHTRLRGNVKHGNSNTLHHNRMHYYGNVRLPRPTSSRHGQLPRPSGTESITEPNQTHF